MKTFAQLLFVLGLLLWQPQFTTAQTTSEPECQDIIRLQNGSVFRGRIEEMKGGGQVLVFRTWNGVVFEFSRAQIRRITQRCKDGGRALSLIRPYDFKETGWYHHTRLGGLIGQAYYGENRLGFQLQHSSGRMFSRKLGVGLGAGVEFFDPKGNDAATYPVFAEIRSYVFPRNITPYFTFGAGWAFTGHTTNERWGLNDTWKGGWLMQAEIGYRIGNNLTIYTGLRLQHKTREWTSVWGFDSGTGVDRIIHKRFLLGVGILL